MFTKRSFNRLSQNIARKGTQELSLDTFFSLIYGQKKSAMSFVQKWVLLWETNIWKLIITIIIKAYLTPFQYQDWWQGKQLWVIYFPAKACSQWFLLPHFHPRFWPPTAFILGFKVPWDYIQIKSPYLPEAKLTSLTFSSLSQLWIYKWKTLENYSCLSFYLNCISDLYKAVWPPIQLPI